MMRKSWLVFANSLQRMRAVSVASLLIGVVLCVFFMVFANLIFEVYAPVKLGYTDYDNSAVSADFERYATEQLGMELVEGDADFLASELVEKRLSALVEIPQGFGAAVLAGSDGAGSDGAGNAAAGSNGAGGAGSNGAGGDSAGGSGASGDSAGGSAAASDSADSSGAGSKGAIQTTFMDDYANRMFIQSYLEQYTVSLSLLAAVAQGDDAQFERMLTQTREQSPAITTTPLSKDQAQRMQDWEIFKIVLGFFLMISCIVAIGMANLVFDDRENGTWQRVRASNVSTVSYVLGICAAGFVVALLMVAVLFGFLAVTGKGATLPLGGALVLSLLYGLFVVGFSLVCGLLAKSRMAVFWLIIVISTVTSLLGGAYFPVDYAPQFMQQLAHFSPPFWFIDALNKVWEGDTTGWLVSALILGLFSLLCFLIAGIKFASRSSTIR